MNWQKKKDHGSIRCGEHEHQLVLNENQNIKNRYYPMMKTYYPLKPVPDYPMKPNYYNQVQPDYNQVQRYNQVQPDYNQVQQSYHQVQQSFNQVQQNYDEVQKSYDQVQQSYDAQQDYTQDQQGYNNRMPMEPEFIKPDYELVNKPDYEVKNLEYGQDVMQDYKCKWNNTEDQNEYDNKKHIVNKRRKYSAPTARRIQPVTTHDNYKDDLPLGAEVKFNFIRHHPKDVPVQNIKHKEVSFFEPSIYSTPLLKNASDEYNDTEPRVCVTPVYSESESISDSGEDSETDGSLTSPDFPFPVIKNKAKLFPQSKIPFIDTHCHLDYMYVRENHYKSFSSYVERKDFPSNFAGCITCFCDPPSLEDPEYYSSVLKEEGIWGAFGLHPHNAPWYSDELLSKLIRANQHPKSVAWGEMGLDFNNQVTDDVKNLQKRVFIDQLKVAVTMKKPLIIHGRDAYDESFNLLKQYVPDDYKIHFHCFSAPPAFAQKLCEYFPNLFIGLTGLITYKNCDLETVVKEFPFDRLLIETDSPYLRPYYNVFIDRDTPRSSTPGMAIIIAQKIADIKELSLDDVLIQIRENVKNMYGI